MAWSRRGRFDNWGYSRFPRHVSKAEKLAEAARVTRELTSLGAVLEPVRIEGRAMAQTFWGKAWCEHIEGLGDLANRLPRGRTYARNGSVLDLKIETGAVRAKVSGSSLYTLEIGIEPLARPKWKKLVSQCTGEIDSVVELLGGRLSDSVMKLLCDPRHGLFPGDEELTMSCSCPDGAWVCKHIAAALYGVGSRLDSRPELLFVLRGVDQLELVGAVAEGSIVAMAGAAELQGEDLSSLFGIELDAPAPALAQEVKKPKMPKAKKPKKPKAARRVAKTRRAPVTSFDASLAKMKRALDALIRPPRKKK